MNLQGGVCSLHRRVLPMPCDVPVGFPLITSTFNRFQATSAALLHVGWCFGVSLYDVRRKFFFTVRSLKY